MKVVIFMLNNNSLAYSVKILAEIIQDLIMFPLWWYSYGLMQLGEGLIKFLINRQKSLALFVWIKNIFKPMYGQQDWQGIMISIFIRFIQIVFRSLVLFFCGILAVLVLLFWLMLPLIAVYGIIFQLYEL